MARLYVLSGQGDRRIEWSRPGLEVRDPEALAAIAQAEALFKQERKRGASGFRLTPGEPAKRIEEFDPSADEIVLIPRMSGG